VPGRGIPGRPPGDLILEAKIVLPPADSPRAAQAYEAFARAAAFDPRG
jgi:curved DNA-binding protein